MNSTSIVASDAAQHDAAVAVSPSQLSETAQHCNVPPTSQTTEFASQLARLPALRSSIRAASVACALVYFVISKVGFEPRLAVGAFSANQVLQFGVMAGLAAMLWCGDVRRIVRSRTVWLVSALALLLAVQALGAHNTAYASAKPLGYLGLVIPAFAVFAAGLRSRDDVRRFLTLWALIGSGMMALGLVLLATGNAPPRLAVFGGGSNGYARIVSTAFLLWLGLDTRLGPRRIPVWVLALPAFALTLLFAGSKAAILGLGISLAVLGLFRRNRTLLVCAVTGIALFALAPVWTHEIARHANKNRGEVRMFIDPDTHDPRGSYGTRLTYYRRSLEFLKSAPLWGVGTGEWHSVVGLPSGRRHPHNMELELACELGLAGVAWLLAMLVVAARWLYRLQRTGGSRRSFEALIAVLAFWMFNAQLNGDLLDNRWIWLAILLTEILVSMQDTAHERDAGRASDGNGIAPDGTQTTSGRVAGIA